MLRTTVTQLLGFRLGRRAPVSAAAAEREYHYRVLDDFFGRLGPVSVAAAERYRERVLDDLFGRRAPVSTAADEFFWDGVGSFDKNDPSVGTGIFRHKMIKMTKLQIKVDDATGKIVDACHETVGCRIELESSSVVTEWAKGKNLEEVTSIKTREISKYLFPPLAKLHPLLLQLATIKSPEDLDSLKDAEKVIRDPVIAIKIAVEDYKTKKANRC
ncbi:iron-sulfur cluster assembly protein 1-like [Zingiber officinale]|uniref:NIF system FeS cluster assembly NifU N-terminal domain-containing protein n=1 Tax=Zingiber officinale TaxID=94328 RepID=A0A8J5I0I5_ZINOF|nr:iron-sulfur cluster assembly protein 1-like [Zingiber officinale]KAG6530607.1 hypothetical protein ZIOFF_012848 [Zingiber officinale]